MISKIIATDFDGTLCESKWPEIGEANDEVINYLKSEQQQGSKIILWTCRIGAKRYDAVGWCKEHGLCFDAVNENVPEAIKMFGSDTRKIFANEYIDDRMCTLFKLPYLSSERR